MNLSTDLDESPLYEVVVIADISAVTVEVFAMLVYIQVGDLGILQVVVVVDPLRWDYNIAPE